MTACSDVRRHRNITGVAVAVMDGRRRAGWVDNDDRFHPTADPRLGVGDLLTDWHRHAPQEPDPAIDLADAVLCAPLDAKARVFCIGRNYPDHAAEVGSALPAYPSLFLRTHASLSGHRQAIIIPSQSDTFDFEGEVAVVIGRAGRHIADRKAWMHVAGATCFGDHSVRDYQFHTSQATAGKIFERSGAMGPSIRLLADPSVLKDARLVTRLNGEIVQCDSTRHLLFGIPRLIAYLSSITTLQPGDVIATGTPAGVGFTRKPPLFIAAGDTLEVDVEGIGCLQNRAVREETAAFRRRR